MGRPWLQLQPEQLNFYMFCNIGLSLVFCLKISFLLKKKILPRQSLYCAPLGSHSICFVSSVRCSHVYLTYHLACNQLRMS